jgi:hypothetical protein
MIQIYSFVGLPTENGIEAHLNIPLNKLTQVIIVFFRSVNDFTCAYNPKYKNFQLKMSNRVWPDEAIDTGSRRFYLSQLQANLLNRMLQCTQSFEDSYVNPEDGDPENRGYCGTDNSTFVCSIPITNPKGNAFTDEGLSSGDTNTVLSIKGERAAKTAAEDVYYHQYRAGETMGSTGLTTVRAPTYVGVETTFFVYTIAADGYPKCHYETTLKWNAFFKQFFPDDVLQEDAKNLLAAKGINLEAIANKEGPTKDPNSIPFRTSGRPDNLRQYAEYLAAGALNG